MVSLTNRLIGMMLQKFGAETAQRYVPEKGAAAKDRVLEVAGRRTQIILLAADFAHQAIWRLESREACASTTQPDRAA